MMMHISAFILEQGEGKPFFTKLGLVPCFFAFMPLCLSHAIGKHNRVDWRRQRLEVVGNNNSTTDLGPSRLLDKTF